MVPFDPTLTDRQGRERRYVWVLKPWEDEPVLHAFGDSRLNKVPGEMRAKIEDETVCGRPIVAGELALPLKHGLKFGRLCQQCWQKDEET